MKQWIITWGKRMVIGFFALIFILGFFSKSLVGLTLPNVITEKISSGTEVKTTSEEWGIIVPKKTEHYLLDHSAIVKEVLVKKGSYVRKGDRLFRVSLMIEESNLDPQAIQSAIKLEQDKIAQRNTNTTMQFSQQAKEAEETLKTLASKLSEAKLLYSAQAISKEELTAAENNYNHQVTLLQNIEKSHDLQKSQDALENAATRASIEALEKKLLQTDHLSPTYTKLDSEGYALAFAEGYMTAVPTDGRLYSRGETLASLGICSSYKDLCYEVRMSQRMYYQAAEYPQPLAVTNEDGLSIGVISFDYRGASFEDGDIVVRGDFNQEPDIWVFPGLKVVSRSSYSRYIGDEVMAIPRSAIVSTGTNIEGNASMIYLIRSEEDALGKSDVAVATAVQVVSMTDDYAIVQDLEFMVSDQVIVNPSAKIKDGTKVYVCP